MKRLFLLAMPILFFALSSHSQSPDTVRLKNGQTLFSTTLRLLYPDTADKYLLLDHDLRIPLSQVDRYHSSLGTFITVPGSSGTDIYRIETEGPHLSLYSQLTLVPDYNPDEPAYTYSRQFFYRKPGQTIMQPVTYNSLMLALADNPASQQELHIGRAQIIGGFTLSGASLILATIGIIETAHRNAPQFTSTPAAATNPYTGGTYPYTGGTYPYGGTNPNTTPTTPQVTSGHYFSPLIIIGSVGFTAGIVISLTARHHENRAIQLYNQP